MKPKMRIIDDLFTDDEIFTVVRKIKKTGHNGAIPVAKLVDYLNTQFRKAVRGDRSFHKKQLLILEKNIKRMQKYIHNLEDETSQLRSDFL